MQKTAKIFGRDVKLSMRDEGDLAIANELFLDHQYRYCDEVIRKAAHAVIDIGGHLGFFSLYASLLNPKVPIYSFEPHGGNFSLLKENLKLNRVKNVTAKNLAVANRGGEVLLKLSQEHLNHSLVHAIEDTGETQKANATTLEKILKQYDIEKVDLLKLDCEGAEFQIIEECPPEILKRVDYIFLEYHDWVPSGDHRGLKKFLETRSYRVQDFPNSKMPELGFLWCAKIQA